MDFLGQMLAELGPHASENPALATLNRWRKTYLCRASELQLDYSLRAYRAGWPLPLLTDMDLRGAALNGWRLGRDNEDALPRLLQLDMAGLQLQGAPVRRARFWNVRLDNTRLDGATLTQAEFVHCAMPGSVWTGADAAGCTLRHCDTGLGAPAPHGIAPLTQPLPPLISSPAGHVPPRIALLGMFPGVQNASKFSPDGTQALSAGDDGTLRLWSLASGECIRVFQGHQGWILSCAFSPDGTQALSAGHDGTLRLWSLASGECIRVFRGHQGWVVSCAFSPDGTQALSAGHDSPLRLWEVNTGTSKTFMLHSHQATAAWQVSTGALLHASGRAWRYLRWQRLDTQGRTQVWPLEPELTTVL